MYISFSALADNLQNWGNAGSAVTMRRTDLPIDVSTLKKQSPQETVITCIDPNEQYDTTVKLQVSSIESFW